jgi:hypothetical protein
MELHLSIRERYLLEASRVRAEADKMRAEHVRSELLAVARCYEELAATVGNQQRLVTN